MSDRNKSAGLQTELIIRRLVPIMSLATYLTKAHEEMPEGEGERNHHKRRTGRSGDGDTIVGGELCGSAFFRDEEEEIPCDLYDGTNESRILTRNRRKIKNRSK